jgi:hypothetical protein
MRFIKHAALAAVLMYLFASGPVYSQAHFHQGLVFEGEARSDDSGRTWPVQLSITSFAATTGQFGGEMTWPSLNSIHRLEGRIWGSTVTFKETGYIKQGGAHLNCEYALILEKNILKGRWVEAGGDRGTLRLQLRSTGAGGSQSDSEIYDGMIFKGEVKSTNSNRTWPASIKIAGIQQSSGDFDGEISWPSLNAVNRIVGKIMGKRIIFKETAYIKQGGAHLNCEYDFIYDGNTLQGVWTEPGADSGTAIFQRQR